MQVQLSSVFHFQHGYFDLVNPVDQVKHVSQCSDYTNQQWLYFLETCRRLILESQFSLDGHSYWVLEFIILFYWLWPSFLLWDNDIFGISVHQWVWVVTSTILPCLQTLLFNQFAPFLSWKKILMDFNIFRACTTKIELWKSLKKSIWLVWL